MRNKFTLLLLSLFLPLMAHAQVVDDTIRTLIISEIRFTGYSAADTPEGYVSGGFLGDNYVELTNVGSEPVNLSEFKVATLKHDADWGHPTYGFGANDRGYWATLPDYTLQPGESYLIATVRDYPELAARDDKAFPSFQTRLTWQVIKDNVDFPVYLEESDVENGIPAGEAGTQMGEFGPDSISAHRNLFNNWPVYEDFAFVVEHHVGDDSVVVDAVNYQDFESTAGRQTVAGIPMAAFKNHLLVRKTNVTEGSTDWAVSRGASLEDSDWIPIPLRRNWEDPDQKYFTTLKVHSDATLDETTFKPAEGSAANIDWTTHTITIPWGIYADYVINEFDLGDNIAWEYKLNDGQVKNMYNTAADDDTLVMYALGNELEQQAFAIDVVDAPADLATVYPLNKKDEAETRFLRYYDGSGWSDFYEPVPGSDWKAPYWVSIGNAEMDTIGNIPFATRTDTLLKYIEKAPNASWEFVWVDGVERADLKHGDILKVTAEDGTTVNEYFLNVFENPEKSHNAYLDAITWPDAPSYLRQDPSWREDTIPGFNRERFYYRIELPYGTTNVPGLVPQSEDLNAQISVDRATQVVGNVEDRTTIFTVAAEDDTTLLEYKIEFVVEVKPEDSQPYHAEPIFTQFAKRMKNRFNMIEISNPGNQPLDLSNYMVVIRRNDNQSLAEMISYHSTEDNHPDYGKYLRYVPGYMYYVDSLYNAGQWGYLQKDLMTNPVIKGGESFVIGAPRGGTDEEIQTAVSLMDVIVTRGDYTDAVPDLNIRYINTGSSEMINHFWGKDYAWALLKITNDSVKAGTKRVGDPADYELVDLFGDYAGEAEWYATGDTTGGHGWMVMRKPEFYKGDTLPGYQGSWGPTPEESEWILTVNRNVWHPGFGSHAFAEITEYVSTVNSYMYNVSDGYEDYQDINGVVTGTTVSEFLLNILKKDEGQTLEVKHRTGDDVLENNDTLIVTSADGQNATQYVLAVGEGLNDDAVLVAKSGSGYTIDIDGSTGTITGIPFGARIEEVLNNVTKPYGATLNILDEKGMVTPLQVRNNEGLYVKKQASSKIFFEVVSENNQNKILYQLIINVKDNAAIVTSDVYTVDQDIKLISLIPGGTNVSTFMGNVAANEGATMKLVDKLGSERTIGEVAFDDRLVVTSPDETVTKEYFLLFMEESLGGEAWVVSDVLDVDQVEMTISNIDPNTTKSIFEALIEVAPRANIILMDADGNVVDATSSVVESDYQLKVTSGDGLVEVVYILDVNITEGVHDAEISDIKAYPNPASDRIVVEGLEESNQVVIVNMVGSVVKTIHNTNYYRTSIFIGDLPAGIYMLYSKSDRAKSNIVKFVKQ